jgi:hypothetical protein
MLISVLEVSMMGVWFNEKCMKVTDIIEPRFVSNDRTLRIEQDRLWVIVIDVLPPPEIAPLSPDPSPDIIDS